MAASFKHGDEVKMLADSLQSFCRSIELCDDYLRGFYGLKLVCILALFPLHDNQNPKPTY